jgi:hypothetical protein
MDVIVTTPDQLRAIIADCLANINLIPKADPSLKQEIEKPISQPEALEFLGKSRQTFTTWRRKGFITARTLGGRVYYLKSELLEAMKHSAT